MLLTVSTIAVLRFTVAMVAAVVCPDGLRPWKVLPYPMPGWKDVSQFWKQMTL